MKLKESTRRRVDEFADTDAVLAILRLLGSVANPDRRANTLAVVCRVWIEHEDARRILAFAEEEVTG